jgi:hypothetical protein
MPHLRIKLEPLAANRLQWRAGSERSFTAIRKVAELFCRSFLRKGKVFAYVGRIQTPKNPKDLKQLTL